MSGSTGLCRTVTVLLPVLAIVMRSNLEPFTALRRRKQVVSFTVLPVCRDAAILTMISQPSLVYHATGASLDDGSESVAQVVLRGVLGEVRPLHRRYPTYSTLRG